MTVSIPMTFDILQIMFEYKLHSYKSTAEFLKARVFKVEVYLSVTHLITDSNRP